MKQKEIKLARDAQGKWSYKDEDFQKDCMNAIEVTALFIARFAASIQVMDQGNQEVGIEIMLIKDQFPLSALNPQCLIPIKKLLTH